MVSTRRSSSSTKLSMPSPVPRSKHLKAENSDPKEVPVAPRGDVPNSKELAPSSSRYQLPSDPATGSVEDPAPAETPASNPDAAVDKPVAMPPPSPDSASEKLNPVPSTWNNRLDLGNSDLLPLEVCQILVGSGLSSNMIRFFQTPSGSWSHEVPFADVHITLEEMAAPSSFSKICFNPKCGASSSERWWKGWRLRSGDVAELCDRCDSAYDELGFCEDFHFDAAGGGTVGRVERLETGM
ncbi:B3 domain-containing transcription repressor [Nymphaea thermarum]|nr:B3 domain-containing transcription repressor [Nymphaea thermarum]